MFFNRRGTAFDCKRDNCGFKFLCGAGYYYYFLRIGSTALTITLIFLALRIINYNNWSLMSISIYIWVIYVLYL